MVRRRREGLRRKPQTSRNFHTDVYIRAIFFAKNTTRLVLLFLHIFLVV
jgi:hypothetical protein